MQVFPRPQIFTGYTHLGTCREFVWLPEDPIGGKPVPARFMIRGLRCEHDLEGLMIRKDLFLHTADGQEYLVANFQIVDISNLDEIRGIASAFRLLLDEFPEVKAQSHGHPAVITKDTHLHAFRAVSALIGSIHVKQQIDAKDAGIVINELARDITSTPQAVLNLLAIKSFDDYTFSHNINVATISLLIGHALGLSADDLHDLGIGALMHDLGKLRLSQRLLSKEGRLTSGEFAEIARHPRLGADLLTDRGGVPSDVGPHARAVILHHHERFGGSGYPQGQKGDQISLFARICAIADVFDALTTDRPFRAALPPHEAVRTLMSQVSSHFDPEILQVFINLISLYPPGTVVELDDGRMATVIRANPGHLLRPVVKVVGTAPQPHHIIDLTTQTTRFIKRPLPHLPR
jgi:HD-GYP domain-containing protein (c-di-GMP phosphodiesterase class II)